MDMLMDDIAGIWPSGRLPHGPNLAVEAVEALSAGCRQSSNKRDHEKHADIELVTRMHCPAKLTTAP